MGEIFEFNWERREITFDESAQYEAKVIHGDFFLDTEDPETYEENVVVLGNLPIDDNKDRTEQIKELVEDVFPESDLVEVTSISLARDDKKKFFKKMIKKAVGEEDKVIQLRGGATAIIKDNQRAS